MRGRKLDSEFICVFIKECAKNNLSSVKDIINEAKLRINNIDNLILKVEKLKIKRKKLFDVILSFEEQIKETNNIDINMITFSKIINNNVCKLICDKLIEDVDIETLYLMEYDRQEIIFCIKQLIDNKIIIKTDSLVSKGNNFDSYIKYMSRKS
jgi:hypothetical protein